MRILVVDDDEVLLRATVSALTAAKFEVSTASCGEKGLELLASQRFDAVLVDLMMPKMNGIELIRMLRARDPSVRIVLTSSFPVSCGQLDRMGLESVAFVAKPAKHDELVAALRGDRPPTSPTSRWTQTTDPQPRR